MFDRLETLDEQVVNDHTAKYNFVYKTLGRALDFMIHKNEKDDYIDESYDARVPGKVVAFSGDQVFITTSEDAFVTTLFPNKHMLHDHFLDNMDIK